MSFFFRTALTTWRKVTCVPAASSCVCGCRSDSEGLAEKWGLAFDISKRWLCVWEESEPQNGDKIQSLVRAGACSVTFEWSEGKQAVFAWSQFSLALCSTELAEEMRSVGCFNERDHLVPKKAAGKHRLGAYRREGEAGE